MSSEFNKYALFYHSIGFNVVCIGNQINFNNYDDGNTLKAPNHIYENLFENRQTIEDVNSYNWNSATGVGIILGFNNIIALDIDGIDNIKFVSEILKILKLPSDYKWVAKSGSGTGYHVILKCNNIDPRLEDIEKGNIEEAQLILKTPSFGQGRTNAYYPKRYSRAFCKLEFKWIGNLTMHPSLHVTGQKYDFVFGIPDSKPTFVDFLDLKIIKDNYCSLQANVSEALNDRFVTYHSFADHDEKPYNYERRKKEPFIVLNICKYNITETPDKLDSSLTQLSWFVLDRNYNPIKRKTYNYLNKHFKINKGSNAINYDTAEKIITDKRNIYFELIYDLIHSEVLITTNLDLLNYIIEDGHKIGLYIEDYINANIEILNIFKEESIKSENKLKDYMRVINENSGLKFYFENQIERLTKQDFDKHALEFNKINSNVLTFILYKLFLRENNIKDEKFISLIN